jgi:hypothetical protein
MDRKAWIISVNMGYGHQRTAFAMRDLGYIINANDYSDIPLIDKNIWEKTRKFYEFISRLSSFPFLGKKIFALYDNFQKIFHFYPKRDLSKPNFNIIQTYNLIKKGWGRHLIYKLSQENKKIGKNIPIVSTFFVPAFMAEYFGYSGEIFCVVCDADISRAWAPFRPNESKIKYFAPTERVVERLIMYGVKRENIFLTGYPLPKENIGGTDLKIAKVDLFRRLPKLDPKGIYRGKYKKIIESIFEDFRLHESQDNKKSPLTIMFAIGGAGAQREVASKILFSLKEELQKGIVKIILSVGIKKFVREYFIKKINELELSNCPNIVLLYSDSIFDYFASFDTALRETDILWTKPSELCFYSALGIPMIVSYPIGSQEESNKRWLLKSGFGVSQEDPLYTKEWLFDWVDKGYLAKAALQAFIEGENLGIYRIERIIKNCAR